MNIVELKNKKINELTKLAKQLNIEGPGKYEVSGAETMLSKL